MKRIIAESPVTGYQLFRYGKTKADGSLSILPKYYIRHKGKDTCTGTDRLNEAKLAVKRLAGLEAQERRANTPARVTVGMLLDLVLSDYAVAGHKTIADARGKIERGLRPFFGDTLAASVTSGDIEKWIAWRATKRTYRSLKHGYDTYQAASLNRELSLLRRAYQLGYTRKPQLVDRIPPIKKLPENNVRKGFVTPGQYRRLMEELPSHLRPITCVAFHVANRRGELLNLEWADVELEGDPPLITLWPGETKNKNGRTLPILAGEMLDTLQALKEEHDAKWPQQTKVFVRPDGTALAPHDIRQDWDAACERAGVPGMLFHDLRRSAVRNLRRAGVSQTVAREFSGHKTDSVFSRYNITDFDDLRDAAAKLGRFLTNSREK